MIKTMKKIFLSVTLVVAVTHAQDVSIMVGDTSFAGYTDDIVVTVMLSNPNSTVGGMQFDVSVEPSMVMLSGVSPVGIGSSFSADYSQLNNGSSRVVFYNGSGPDGISSGASGSILNLHFSGSTVLSAVLGINISNLIVSDEDGVIVSAQSSNGNLTIGDVIYLSGSTATADVLETVEIDFSITNSGAVGGLQFDLKDSPNYLDLVSLETTERTTGFSVDFNNVDNDTYSRIVIYSTDNANIDPGAGSVLTATFEVHNNAYADSVSIFVENVVVTDGIGGNYWIASADSATVIVYPGYIEEPHNLVAEDGMDAQVLLTWDAPYGPIPEEFTEDFEGGVIPDGWLVNTNGNGWYVSENASSNWWTIPGHTYYAVSNDDGYNGQDTPDNDGNDYLIMPVVNMSGASIVTLNFASYFTGEYSETAAIAVSTDGGESFTDVVSIEPASQWVMTSVDLSQFGGNQNVLVAFHANDNGGWASGWAVDDIIMTFSNVQITRHIHFELTELGSWALTADKNEMMELLSLIHI